MELAGGEEEGRQGEGGVGQGDGAEVGGVDLVSDLAREMGEVRERLERLWSVPFFRLLMMGAWEKREVSYHCQTLR